MVRHFRDLRTQTTPLHHIDSAQSQASRHRNMQRRAHRRAWPVNQTLTIRRDYAGTTGSALESRSPQHSEFVGVSHLAKDNGFRARQQHRPAPVDLSRSGSDVQARWEPVNDSLLATLLQLNPFLINLMAF